jgi:hypothetical protein
LHKTAQLQWLIFNANRAQMVACLSYLKTRWLGLRTALPKPSTDQSYPQAITHKGRKNKIVLIAKLQTMEILFSHGEALFLEF